MVSPAIALRFRDTTPEVDTIQAHQNILDERRAVWWGWWKKAFEDDHADDLAALQRSYPIEILIVDRSTKRMFRATCTQQSDGTGIDLALVPQYYRGYAKQVFWWFLLRSIEPVKFSEDIAQRFGETTLIVMESKDDARSGMVAARASALEKSCVLHLSDLHFGADYDFIPRGQTPRIGDLRRSLTECIASDLKRINLADDIAAVVVTGDFTTAGDWDDGTREQILREFEALRGVLKLDREQVIAVPGNHDIVRYPNGTTLDVAKMAVSNQTSYKHEREFRTFAEELVGRHWNEPLNYVRRVSLQTADVLICVLNSCTIVATEWTEYGFVGDTGIEALGKLREEKVTRPTYKLMALHHHLLPVSEVEVPHSKGVTLSLDAAALLDAAQGVGVHIALHGHQHMPRLARYQTLPLMGRDAAQPLHIVSNGSTGAVSRRRPGSERNTYCAFKLDSEHVGLWIRELRTDGKEGATLFQGELEIRPDVP